MCKGSHERCSFASKAGSNHILSIAIKNSHLQNLFLAPVLRFVHTHELWLILSGANNLPRLILMKQVRWLSTVLLNPLSPCDVQSTRLSGELHQIENEWQLICNSLNYFLVGVSLLLTCSEQQFY